MKKGIYFVSGIDTNIGKSYATGYVAKQLLHENRSVITQKLIQTGNAGYSEDILCHRKLMGIDLLPEDKDFTTMPEIYSYPCSPHLAAEIDQRPINFDRIEQAANLLASKYDIVLQEGAGGLMVPLTRECLTIDYIQDKGYPLLLVASGRLGSINHILLSLEAIRRRNIPLYALVYNLYDESDDAIIREDTERYINGYMRIHFPDTRVIVLPVWS